MIRVEGFGFRVMREGGPTGIESLSPKPEVEPLGGS